MPMSATSSSLQLRDISTDGLQGHCEAIPSIVQGVLEDWTEIDRGSVQVEVKAEGSFQDSGTGGLWGSVDRCMVYKVTSLEGALPSLAFHYQSAERTADAISEARMESAQLHFAQHSLAPARLATGADWFIEAWTGSCIGTAMQVTDGTTVEEVARLLAQIHATPTDWFDACRDHLLEAVPALKSVASGSHVWFYATQQKMIDGFTEETMKIWSDAMPALMSSHASRVVTCHGDFQPSNILRSEKGSLQAIDFEFSCVSSAVQDLAHAFMYFLKGEAQKRAFLTAYLEASGISVTSTNLDDLMLDCEVYQLASLFGPLYRESRRLKMNPAFPMNGFRDLLEILERVKGNEDACRTIFEKGMMQRGKPNSILKELGALVRR